MGLLGQLDRSQDVVIAKAFLFAGIFLMGLPSATWLYAYRRLWGLGFKNLANFQVWSAYRENRSKQGWPSWPEYLCWSLLILAVMLLIKGASLLSQL